MNLLGLIVVCARPVTKLNLEDLNLEDLYGCAPQMPPPKFYQLPYTNIMALCQNFAIQLFKNTLDNSYMNLLGLIIICARPVAKLDLEDLNLEDLCVRSTKCHLINLTNCLAQRSRFYARNFATKTFYNTLEHSYLDFSGLIVTCAHPVMKLHLKDLNFEGQPGELLFRGLWEHLKYLLPANRPAFFETNSFIGYKN
jgi:hypothetical protein